MGMKTKLMMIAASLLMCSLPFAYTNCSKADGDGGQPVSALASIPFIDQVYFWGVTKANGDALALLARFNSDGTMRIVEILFPQSNYTVGYTNVSAGTYTASGNQYSLTYTHETCKPVHQDQFSITTTDASDSIDVVRGAVTLIMNNSKKYSATFANYTNTLIEDTTCAHFP